MSSFDSILELGRLALNVEYMRASVSSENIANHGLGFEKSTNFNGILKAAFMSYVSGDIENQNDSELRSSLNSHVVTRSADINLDQQVRLMADAEQRFKVIAEALDRRMALKNIATKYGV